jgi:hypothetical protein
MLGDRNICSSLGPHHGNMNFLGANGKLIDYHDS